MLFSLRAHNSILAAGGSLPAWRHPHKQWPARTHTHKPCTTVRGHTRIIISPKPAVSGTLFHWASCVPARPPSSRPDASHLTQHLPVTLGTRTQKSPCACWPIKISLFYRVCVCCVDVIVWSVEGIHIIRDLPHIGYTVCLSCAPVEVSACICWTRLGDPRHRSVSWRLCFPRRARWANAAQTSPVELYKSPLSSPSFLKTQQKKKVRHLLLPHSLLSVSAF